MRKTAVASTYATSAPSHDNSSAVQGAPPHHLSLAQSQPSSSFSNAYNSYFAPPAISYSTPAPSITGEHSAQIEEVSNVNSDPYPSHAAPTVGAVLPSSSYQSFVLSDDSENSGSHDDVSPISVPHLIWKGQVWNSDDVQVPYDCLLDDGAHLVLIRPETVTDLGLPIRRLKEPVSVTLALNNNPDSVKEFYDYVFLSLSSLNNAWSSKPVRALIAPGLCTNILLGLPFLVHNKIVIDHEARTAVDKSCGFDLLNENTFCRSRIPPSNNLSPIQKRKIIWKHKKNLLCELKIKCVERLRHLENNGLLEEVTPFNPIAAITERINILASEKNLTDLEKNIKLDFKDVFRPIPHISELPTSETARIQLNKECI